MDSPANIVIAGAGLAGLSAAEALRQRGYDGRLIVLNAEDDAPYERPPLSKDFLSGKRSAGDLHLRTPEFLSGAMIELLPDTASRVDVRSQRVFLASGSALPFDRLLLATGSKPRTLQDSADVPLHYLRTLADARAVKEQIRPGQRIALVGGGYISLEIAATAATMGCEAVILESQPRLLPRINIPSLTQFITARHVAAGIRLHLGCTLRRLRRTGSVMRIDLDSSQSVEADCVIVGIGAAPDVALAQEAGLDIGNGIRVRQDMTTSCELVYAAGDNAEYWNGVHDCWLRTESWQNAERQGRIAAGTMLGSPAIYSETPWFWTDQYEDNIQLLGAPTRWDREIRRGCPEDGKFSAFLLQDGIVVGAAFVNDARNVRPTRLAIEKRQAADPALLEQPEVPVARAFA